MEKRYLEILEDSLKKKLEVLEAIAAYNARQQEIFQADRADLDAFDESIEEKGALIERIALLDEGFESLYAKVSQELQDNRAQYAAQIQRLQTLVRQVTEKSVAIRAQEARNKSLIEEYFKKERLKIRNDRKGSKAAYDYYKSANRAAYAAPQFLDSRQ